MERIISLSASGSISVPSDMLTINTGIQTQAKTARDALSENNEMMQKIIVALKNQGLQSSDIQSVNFSIHPLYAPAKKAAESRIDGYEVTNDIRISIGELEKAGTILDKVVTLGINQINGLNFGVRETEKLKEAARRKAMAKVIDKAKLYTQEAGLKLGKIKNITENYSPSIERGAPQMMRSAEAFVPVEGGNSTISAQVSVVWELLD